VAVVTEERNTLIRITGLINGGVTAFDGQFVVEYDPTRADIWRQR
jgi:hypothetical protein